MGGVDYVETVLVLDIESKRLDSVVDGRNLADNGGMELVLARFCRCSLLVAEDCFCRACLRHAARQCPVESPGRGMQRQCATNNKSHSSRNEYRTTARIVFTVGSVGWKRGPMPMSPCSRADPWRELERRSCEAMTRLVIEPRLESVSAQPSTRHDIAFRLSTILYSFIPRHFTYLVTTAITRLS